MVRVRQGRSFAARQVMVSQAEDVIFMALMSFTQDRDGLSHNERPGPAADLDPEAPPPRSYWLERHRDSIPEWWSGPIAVDLRFVDEPPHVLPRPRQARTHQQLWMRAEGPLVEARHHDCVFTFASDLTLLDPVVLAHGRSWNAGDLKAASLDHSIWYHRPVRMDSWMLYEQESPIASGARGLALGRVFSAEGDLKATVAQGGLLQLIE